MIKEKKKRGRKILPDKFKRSHIFTIREDEKFYNHLVYLKEKSNGEFRSFADIFRFGVSIIDPRHICNRDDWMKTLIN